MERPARSSSPPRIRSGLVRRWIDLGLPVTVWTSQRNDVGVSSSIDFPPRHRRGTDRARSRSAHGRARPGGRRSERTRTAPSGSRRSRRWVRRSTPRGRARMAWYRAREQSETVTPDDLLERDARGRRPALSVSGLLPLRELLVLRKSPDLAPRRARVGRSGAVGAVLSRVEPYRVMLSEKISRSFYTLLQGPYTSALLSTDPTRAADRGRGNPNGSRFPSRRSIARSRFTPDLIGTMPVRQYRGGAGTARPPAVRRRAHLQGRRSAGPTRSAMILWSLLLRGNAPSAIPTSYYVSQGCQRRSSSSTRTSSRSRRTRRSRSSTATATEISISTGAIRDRWSFSTSDWRAAPGAGRDRDPRRLRVSRRVALRRVGRELFRVGDDDQSLPSRSTDAPAPIEREASGRPPDAMGDVGRTLSLKSPAVLSRRDHVRAVANLRA